MKKTILLQLFLGWTAIAAAQSTICHEDGTVTFQYKNDQAKEVMVDVQFAGRNAMKRDAQGLWTVTLGPAAPDMYPYCFIVDGVSVMDPENPQYFPNEGFKNSLLEIPAREGSLAHDIKNVPHGSLEYIHYYSPRVWEPRIRRWSICRRSTRRILRRNILCSISSAERRILRRFIIR